MSDIINDQDTNQLEQRYEVLKKEYDFLLADLDAIKGEFKILPSAKSKYKLIYECFIAAKAKLQEENDQLRSKYSQDDVTISSNKIELHEVHLSSLLTTISISLSSILFSGISKSETCRKTIKSFPNAYNVVMKKMKGNSNTHMYQLKYITFAL